MRQGWPQQEAAKTYSEAAEAAAEEAMTAAAAAELERDPLTWRIDSENDIAVKDGEKELELAMLVAAVSKPLNRKKRRASL